MNAAAQTYNANTCIINTAAMVAFGYTYTPNGYTYINAGTHTRGPMAERVAVLVGTRGRYQTVLLTANTIKSATGQMLGSVQDECLHFLEPIKWTTKRRASMVADQLAD